MSRIPIRIACAFLVLVCTSPTFGWGGDGHKIVGKIAIKHLTPEAKAGVGELLGKRTLADVSVWADYIKSDPTYKWASPLHYANVRRGAKAFNLRRDCPKPRLPSYPVDEVDQSENDHRTGLGFRTRTCA